MNIFESVRVDIVSPQESAISRVAAGDQSAPVVGNRRDNHD